MIRAAHELDVPRLAVLAELYTSEVHHHDSMTFDLEFAMSNIATAMMHEDSCILVCVDKSGEVIGFFWGFVTPLPWSRELIGIDNVLYVMPSVRGKAHGVRLIKAYEQWVKRRGAKQVSLSIASGITEEATGKLYQRMGYEKIGFQYRKEIYYG